MAYNDIPLSLPAFIALYWSLLITALVFVVLHFSLRRRLKSTSRAANLSDGLVTLSWLTGLVTVGIFTWKDSLRQKYIHWPDEKLYYMVPYDQAGNLLKVSFISLFFQYVSIWCCKAAFLAFYWELFSIQSRRIRMVIIAAAVFTFCTLMVQMLVLGLWCHPVEGNWNVMGDLCSAVHSIKGVSIMTSADISTDIVILLIPISTLARTQMGRMEISGLLFVLLMGSLSILAALARFVVLKIVEKWGGAKITHTINVLGLIEIVASIIAVCLPSLRALLRKHRASYRSSVASSSRTESLSAAKMHPRQEIEQLEVDNTLQTDIISVA